MKSPNPLTRSEVMSRIRGKNTRLEVRLRTALHARGFRYRLHDKRLPGKPDLVLPGRRAVVFIHGCFWHGHDCHLFKLPKTNSEFWSEKIAANRSRDSDHLSWLTANGWNCLVVWECAVRGTGQRPFEQVIDTLALWLNECGKVSGDSAASATRRIGWVAEVRGR